MTLPPLLSEQSDSKIQKIHIPNNLAVKNEINFFFKYLSRFGKSAKYLAYALKKESKEISIEDDFHKI